MKGKMKRLLGALLSVAVCVSLFPSVTFAVEPTTPVISFDFGAAGYTGVAGQTGTSEIGYETLKIFGDPEGEINPTWSKADAPQWVVDGHARATNIALTTVESGNKQANALYWSAFGTRAYQNGVATNTHAVAIRLKIDKPGTYIPELTYHARPDLCIFDIYLVPANSEIMTPANKGYVTIHQTKGENNANLLNRVINNAAAYKLGTLDMYAKEAGRVSTYLIGEHALNAFTVTEETKGEYYLFFRTNGVNDILKKEYGSGSGAAINANLFSLKLYNKADVAVPALASATLSLESTTMTEGESVLPKLTLFLENGDNPSAEMLSGYEIKYESNNPTVASVNENSGEITALKTGNATITVTETKSGVAGKLDITVAGKPYLERLQPKWENFVLFANDDKNSTADLGILAVMSNGKNIVPDEYKITYISADENIVTVDKGTITAVGVGKTTVTASATNENGEPVSVTVNAEVRGELDGLIYNFNAASYGKDKEIAMADLTKLGYAENGSDPWKVLSGANTVYWLSVTADEKVDHPYGANSATNVLAWGIWGYRAARYTGAEMNKEEGTFEGGTYSARQDAAVAALINITRAGTLVPAISYEARNTLSIFDTYLIPKTVVDASSHPDLSVGTEIAKLLSSIDKEKYLIAKHDMYDGSLEEQVTINKLDRFGNIEITETGEYYLIWQVNGINEALQGPENFTYLNNNVNYKHTIYVNIHSFGLYPLPKTELSSTGAHTETEEVFEGDIVRLIATPELADGKTVNTPAIISTFTSLDEEKATINGEYLIAKKAGTVKVKVDSRISGSEDVVTEYVDIEILPESITDISVTAGGSKNIRLTDKKNDTVPLFVTPISNLGNKLPTEEMIFTANALTPEVADIINGDTILPVTEGEAKFNVIVTIGERTIEREATLLVVKGKSRASYMTKEKAEAARENIKKYNWAKKEADGAIAQADRFVDNLDILYNLIASEGIPRGIDVGAVSDPNLGFCRFCGVKISAKYGSPPWVVNAISRPWKIQCPDCKRLFPSNDFKSFYELGLNEYREFERSRALARHHALIHHGDAYAVCDCTPPADEWTNEWYSYYGYGDENGYLYNALYKNVDLSKVDTLNANLRLRPGETQETWGVDDGYGYVPRKEDGTAYQAGSREERHTYIAEYLHYGIWRGGAVVNAIRYCSDAYFYTGNIKYGRVAAILLDRTADFYRDFDRSHWGNWVNNSDGGSGLGKILGNIWEGTNMKTFFAAYDKVFECYDDPFVVEYLSKKSKEIKMNYAKNTPSQIRTNIEDGILRGALEALPGCFISGNFGYPQSANAMAAVVLDTMPDTKYWLDYLMAPGWSRSAPSLGGGINAQLVNDVDADGQGNEGSKYNIDWHTTLIGIQEYLNGYDAYVAANLYNNPKFVKMFYSNIPLVTGNHSANIGDTFTTMSKDQWYNKNQLVMAVKYFDDPRFAQLLYLVNGKTSEGLRYDIYERDPERLADEVQAIIDRLGEISLDSEVMTNFGYAILRDGNNYSDSLTPTAKDTTRNVWMYFGTSAGHAHKDTLNLGMTAFGLEYLPDLGYPEETSYTPNRLQWVGTTLSHNTVTVNEQAVKSLDEPRGESLHFDHNETIQLMDVSAPYVSEETEEYRRSVITVHVDDDNSYAVDFFRVLGGDTHLYSFHAASNEIAKTTGLDFTLTEDENGNYISGSQLDENGNYKGTYAGRDAKYIKDEVTGAVRAYTEDASLNDNEVILEAEWGKDPNSPNEWFYNTIFPRGYTWLKNVDRDIEPENKVEVDFKIKDFNKHLRDGSNLHLYMTVLNSGNIAKGADAEISIADGLPPDKSGNKNIDKLKYVLIKNRGENLDTTFTTVLEPYRKTRYIKSVDELPMTVTGGEEQAGDSSRAVRVEHTSGRVDYILYATNTNVTYEITLNDESKLSFRGFVGVYTVQNGVITYKYLHDGDILGGEYGKASIDGIVSKFTDTLELKNYIWITPKAPLSDDELALLSGKYIFVNNGTENRGGAWRIKAAERDGNDIKLDVGDVTTIRRFKDAIDEEAGFKYTIAKNQSARIPLTTIVDNDPVFAPIRDNLTTNAGSTIAVTVSAASPDTGNASGIRYVGETIPSGARIDAQTGVFTWKPDNSQVGTSHVAITAIDDYGRQSTAHFYIKVYGSTTGGSATDSAENPSDGRDDNSGGSAPAPDKEDTNAGDGGSDAHDKMQFTDLSNHAWAADAINALAADGIIRGTSETTFSPAANITRADFVLLLVRAFKLTSDNTENFADVQASDYFASEIAIARNNGIISGIGENKFAPRNFITRQDMMVIVYRVMQKLGAEFGIYDKPEYPDFTTVADYARVGVSALIGTGLVNGKGGKIAPTDYTTRAEVAVLIKRILEHIK